MTKLQIANRQLELDNKKLAETQRHNRIGELIDIGVSGAKMVGTAVGAAAKAYTSKGADWQNIVRNGADLAGQGLELSSKVRTYKEGNSEVKETYRKANDKKNHYSKHRRKGGKE